MRVQAKIDLASFVVRSHGDYSYGGPGMRGRKLRSRARGRVGPLASGNPGATPAYQTAASDIAINVSIARWPM